MQKFGIVLAIGTHIMNKWRQKEGTKAIAGHQELSTGCLMVAEGDGGSQQEVMRG